MEHICTLLKPTAAVCGVPHTCTNTINLAALNSYWCVSYNIVVISVRPQPFALDWLRCYSVRKISGIIATELIFTCRFHMHAEAKVEPGDEASLQ